MKFNDSVIGLVAMLFGVAVFLRASTFPNAGGLDYGASLFPSIIGIGFVISGLVMVWKGVRARRVSGQRWVQFGEWARSPRNIVSMLLVPVSIAFYMAFAANLGFFITSLLILVAFMLWLRVHWISALLIAVVATLFIDVVFAKFLLVPLPYGLFQPITWLL